MWRIAAFFILSPIYVAVAWGVYLIAKLGASFIVESPIDRTAMAIIAAAIVPAVGFALIQTIGED
jgi:hypothetical protein